MTESQKPCKYIGPEATRPYIPDYGPLGAHPAWLGFGGEDGKHPPMRSWLAAPIVDRNGTNWGLLQLSDKYEGDFTAEDKKQCVAFAGLVSTQLEALWDLRHSRKQHQTKQPKRRREE